MDIPSHFFVTSHLTSHLTLSPGAAPHHILRSHKTSEHHTKRNTSSTNIFNKAAYASRPPDSSQ